MRIGVPKEIKTREGRVACTPHGVQELVNDGHEVLIESGAGEQSGFSDREYADAGGDVVSRAEDAWSAELVIKVKEPIPSEYGHFRDDLLLFTFLHLAANEELTSELCSTGVTGIAYETVERNGHLPLLEPMSEIAGRIGALMGSYHLSKPAGGNGILPGGIPGVPAANVLIVGGGAAGLNAAQVADGMGAEVTVLDIDIDRMKFIDQITHSSVRTVYSTESALMERLDDADLLVCAVLIPGARAPKLITHEHVDRMKNGAVLVDIAIDQGGCAETSRPTTHADPVYTEQGVVHYCVANMPGAYPRTATQALTNATLPYVRHVAGLGLETALTQIPELAPGLNTHRGEVVCPHVAEALGQSAAANPFRATQK